MKRSRRPKGPPRWLTTLTAQVDTPETAALVEAGVAALWTDKRPGREKKKEIIRRIAKVLDEAVNFRTLIPGPVGLIVEGLDHALFRLLLGLPIELAYRAEKAKRIKRTRKPKPKPKPKDED